MPAVDQKVKMPGWLWVKDNCSEESCINAFIKTFLS